MLGRPLELVGVTEVGQHYGSRVAAMYAAECDGDSGDNVSFARLSIIQSGDEVTRGEEDVSVRRGL
jgi:hypothetical protein